MGASSTALASPAIAVAESNSIVVSHWADKSAGNTGWILPGSSHPAGIVARHRRRQITAAVGDSVTAVGTWPGATANSSIAGRRASPGAWSSAPSDDIRIDRAMSPIGRHRSSMTRADCRMLGRFGWWRHAIVAATVAGCGALAALGRHRRRGTASGSSPSWSSCSPPAVTASRSPRSSTSTSATTIAMATNGGSPTTSVCRSTCRPTSPDAPDEVDAVQDGGETRIRIGRSDTTVSGQHRYVLRYTLPQGRCHDGVAGARHHRQRRDARDRAVRGRGHRVRSSTDRCATSVAIEASGGCELTPVDGALPSGHRPARARRRNHHRW